jgi:phosphoglycolate phosphatase-like HAD superfamily hydrolase
MIRCVAFDFDGTLADSNRIKRDAWYEVFDRTGYSHTEISALLAALPTADRFELIKEGLSRLASSGRLPTGDTHGLLAAELAQSYNDICEIGQETCPEMPGAAAMLAALADRLPLYVNSATPEEPLRRVIGRRGWECYFRGVHGRPREKAEILRDIIARERILPTEIAMVGDGPADIQGAQEVGCPFFAVGELTSTPYGQQIGCLADLTGILIGVSST